MAKREVQKVTLTDDLDGSRAARTVAFGVNQADYEIELSAQNIAAFKQALAPYLRAGRPVRPVRKQQRKRTR